MSRTNWTALECARQYLGVTEVPGHQSNPAILAMLKLDNDWTTDDATPWCAAFVNWVAFNMGLERSKSLRARSWLNVGQPVELEQSNGNTVVIFSRGSGKQPGPEVIAAPGHVAFLESYDDDTVTVLGGNQGDKVSIKTYPRRRILGVRRLRRD